MEFHVCATVVTSHVLVASYLRDLLKKFNVDPDPMILCAYDLNWGSVRPGSVILLDLHDLPYPVSAYLDSFQGASVLATGRTQSIADIACLLLTGFAGFVSYADVPSSLADAMQAVARGETWASPEVVRTYVALTSRRTTITDTGMEILTHRETQILELLRKRYSNKEMAGFLGISESTIKFHVSNVFAKLNVSRRRDLSLSVPVMRQIA